MNGSRIALTGSQHDALTKFLESHPAGHEKAAVVLFRRLHLPVDRLAKSDRYIVREIVPFSDEWVTASSPTHIAFVIAPLRELFRRCEEEELVFGFVHNHPEGPPAFSAIDDENEYELLKALRNRNGPNVTFVSMLWVNGQWLARTRRGQDARIATPVRHTLVLGERLHLFGYHESSEEHRELQKRQAAAFGQPFVDMLQSLRVGIVGCGGTGSPLATLIARSGIGELVLIDADRLERSNLNRVRGLKAEDVGQLKVEKLRDFIDGIGLTINVAAYASQIDTDPNAVDALASCDVVFGCTDDFIGREVLNAAVYVYGQLLIDMGLGGRILDGMGGEPMLRYHFGRVSSVFPEWGQCLFCQDVLRHTWISAQLARRENPDITDEELKERYLEDGGAGAPGVGPFTGATADFAAATLYDLIKPFRRFPIEVRRDMFLIDFVKMEISSRQTAGDRDCQYCQKRNFVLLKESCRVHRPFLGKRDEAY